MLPPGPWADPAPQRVLHLLTEAGHQALYVGGTVRNALIGAPVTDLDMATSALPDTVHTLAEGAGFKVIPTGLSHGTVTVIADGHPIEITTFRRDVATDGRHADVAFSEDVAEDASRRDFTMNALYATAGGEVVDPLGGAPDLAARRVRFIGAPEDRIREDYLRILRFFRFTAWYGAPEEGLDAEGLAACAALAGGLRTLSAERVTAELLKLLAAQDPAPAVAAMAQSGVLSRTLPGASAEALAPLIHLEGQLDLSPEPLRRLAGLGGSTDALRLSKAQARRLAELRHHLGALTGPAELGYRLGALVARDVLTLRAALFSTPLDPAQIPEVERGAQMVFPLRAKDLPDALQGPEIGAALRRLETAWIASGMRLSKAELLARL
ncbi:CCA tRNA nucleotidyltransferase [Dinoroseobacter sp. S124A]|uniref:CCA tRNA nucleotidyltransferase n=1 Tax=Dinoroseobacter sp. S124A TaxID=3415128 RepID=UPI003C7D501D